jgi:cysteine desulfurase
VVRTAEGLGGLGIEVVWVAPEPDGRVDPERVARAVSDLGGRCRLVSLQAVNHETGVVQPVEAVRAVAAAHGALLHCDAVQAVGRLLPSSWAGADIVTVAAHKIRGPKGAGAVMTRPGIELAPVILGGAQEKGVRPGTQDPVTLAGFAAAARRARTGHARYAALQALRDRLERTLLALDAAPQQNGTAPRAPHVSNLSFGGWHGPELCAALDLEGVCVSSGSACSAGTAEPSPVITAMLGAGRARSAVRISLGEDSSPSDIDAATLAFKRVLGRV